MWRFCLLVAVIAGFNSRSLAKSKMTREEYSPKEDPATDIPHSPEKFQWLIRDTINGTQISTNGAPVVYFILGEPKIVGSVPTGTPITMNSVRTFRGINYWGITFVNDEGKEREGWISGLFVYRK